jgi:hypothetical protein
MVFFCKEIGTGSGPDIHQYDIPDSGFFVPDSGFFVPGSGFLVQKDK